MESNEFRTRAHELVDWMADFLEGVEHFPVKPNVSPKQIIEKLPDQPPVKGESFDQIFQDFKSLIVPGMTHWQHPKFFAYFNANASPPSILAEMLMSTLGAQCMIWDTSPAATELEEQMMEWLRQMIGLPAGWEGVIHDTASTATLIAILSAREKASNFHSNLAGVGQDKMRVYCSTETHSSIEKAVKIAGIGSRNLVKVQTHEDLSMDASALRNLIKEDRKNGYLPIAIVSTLGTTSTMAIDDLHAIATVSEEEQIWHHVDAAFAGTAAILPEYQWMLKGIEKCDSFVFNPHKWMFVNFDCTAYFVKDKEALIRTFEILPEYLKTKTRGQVNDYRDWGIALGRRFRALKLWFVIRSYGVKGLQEMIRAHIQLAQKFEEFVKGSPDFEIVYPRNLNFMVFRFNPGNKTEEELKELNSKLIQKLNLSGKMYLTHAIVHGRFGIRIVLGQTYLEERHVDEAWDDITNVARN
jgi:aromatic-L-amino-acid decarboxylase